MPSLSYRYRACMNSYFFGFDFSNMSINSLASAAAHFLSVSEVFALTFFCTGFQIAFVHLPFDFLIFMHVRVI